MKAFGALLVAFVVAMTLLCGALFDYCLYSFTKIDISPALDILCGIVTSEILVPVTIVTAILRASGVEVPFFD